MKFNTKLNPFDVSPFERHGMVHLLKEVFSDKDCYWIGVKK